MLLDSDEPLSQSPTRLGFRSALVLAKLGSDFRDQYESVITQPFPPEFNRPLARLDGQEPRLPAATPLLPHSARPGV